MKSLPEMKRDAFILVRLYGDSLGMPRQFEAIPFYQTYPELIRQSLESIYPAKQVCLFNRSVGGGMISLLWSDYQSDSTYFRPDEGDILIIQCGIVDCAPRPIPSTLGKFILHLPKIVQRLVRKFLHTYRPQILHAGFSWRHVLPDEFSSNLTQWLSIATSDFDRIYVINIAPTNAQIEKHSPGLGASIELYNKLIFESIKAVSSKKINLVDVYSRLINSGPNISKYISDTDGHHITLEGHKIYADMIIAREAALAGVDP